MVTDPRPVARTWPVLHPLDSPVRVILLQLAFTSEFAAPDDVVTVYAPGDQLAGQSVDASKEVCVCVRSS